MFPHFLKEDEQLLVESFTHRRVVNGPGLFLIGLFERGKIRKALTLGPTEYVHIRDKISGESRTETGPKLLFLNANDEITDRLQAIALKASQYMRLIDKRTGLIRVERGEKLVTLQPTESILEAARDGVNVDDNTYLIVRDITSGRQSAVADPQVFIPTASQEIVEVRQRIPLKKNEYLRILDKSTGAIRVERGEQSVALGPTEAIIQPVSSGINVDENHTVLVRDLVTGQLQVIADKQVFTPSANQEVVETRKRIPLKKNQYLRLIDTQTGVIRVERGEQSVVRGAAEEILDNVQDGINIDEHHAVLVRDTAAGQLNLINAPQVFMPAPNQEIVAVRERILLEDHETVVIKNRNGEYELKRGADYERSFFLDPYSELIEFHWSAGLHKDKRSLAVTHLDSRPKFMWYEFECRTQDNVELIIGITFFWQLVDVGSMIKTTDDAPGDLCSHARSAMMQAVSQTSLEKFLAAFNTIVRRAVLDSEALFYEERGIRIHAVEVRHVACKDAATQKILQDIIQETTNRLNRLQKQESENEVKVKQVRGEIDAEGMRGQLLEMKHEHARRQALADGEAEALKVKAFFDGLGPGLAAADQIALFNTLRKQDVLESLSAGSAQLYFTPADVDLSIEARNEKVR